MQKKLIALAIAGLASTGAIAETTYSIKGQVNIGIDQYKLGQGTALTAISGTEQRLSDQQSRLVFNAAHTIGGNSKAWVTVDMRTSMDTNQAGTTTYGLTAGNTGVGLMGDWGKLTVGRWELHYNEGAVNELSRVVISQALGTNGMLSQVNGSVVAKGTRSDNVIMYDSANLNGFTGRFAYSTSPRGSEGTAVAPAVAGAAPIPLGNSGGGNAMTGALRYAAGPIKAGVSFYTEDSEDRRANAPNTDQRGTRAYVGYTLPVGLSIGLTLDRSKYSAGTTTVTNPKWAERSAWLVPVKYASGPHGAYFAYGKANSATGTGTVAGADSSAKFTKIGYDYALYKDTNVGVFYTKISNAPAAKYNLFALASGQQTSTLAGQSVSQLYAGLSFSF